MSPGEFVLRVYSVDRAGRLAVGGLRRLTYAGRQTGLDRAAERQIPGLALSGTSS